MLSVRRVALGAFILWLLVDSVVVFRWKTGRSENRDRHSLRVLMILSLVVCFLAIHWAFESVSRVPETWLQWLGLGVMAGGVALRFRSIATLGKFHTPNVAIRAQHRLIEQGPYRYVRHPSYLGALIGFDGFGLALGDWRSFAVFLLVMPLPYLVRIREEEAALATAFGEEYVAYQRRTKRLVPGIY
jgi:protein-S-isoprenylcysteine O-methyltransferase